MKKTNKGIMNRPITLGMIVRFFGVCLGVMFFISAFAFPFGLQLDKITASTIISSLFCQIFLFVIGVIVIVSVLGMED